MLQFLDLKLGKYSSFEELEKNISSGGYHPYIFSSQEINISDFCNLKRAFILAEPGCGKTRLLKEIVIRFQKESAVYIDLKKIAESMLSIEDYIKNNVDEIFTNLSEINNEDDLNRESLIKTNNFNKDDINSITVVLDALDEVPSNKFSFIIQEIKRFDKKYESSNIFISSRRHHFVKYQEQLKNTSFDYITIGLLDYEQVSIYLKNQGILEKDIENLWTDITFQWRDNILQIPRYLYLTAFLLKNNHLDLTKPIQKSEIFDKFIFYKIKEDYAKEDTGNVGEVEIIKRILEKIALLMEMKMDNTITKEEMITFFDDVKSDLKINFFQNSSFKKITERSVLKDSYKNGVDIFEFENTEFQEYLAAKEISRLGNIQQIVFDLIIDSDLNEIKPSWFNTLRFLVDIDISILEYLLDFKDNNRSITEDEEYHRLLTISNIKKLDKKVIDKIFESTLSYYQKNLIWIPLDIAENLSYYFQNNHEIILKEDARKKDINDYIRRGNISSIIYYLLKNNKLNSTQKEYWKQRINTFLKGRSLEETKKNDVLERHVLLAFGQYKDITLLKKNENIINRTNLLDEAFLKAYKNANPNHPFSIKCFVEGTKKERSCIYARYGIYEIKTEQGILDLLNYFIEDEVFLRMFIRKENIFEKKDDAKLIKNINSLWSKDIEDRLKNIIQIAADKKDSYHFQKSHFLKKISLLLQEKNHEYIFELIDFAKKDNTERRLYSLENIFVKILKEQDVEKFIKELKPLDRGDTTALWTLLKISSSSRSDAKIIYEKGREYFIKDYSKWEKQSNKNEKKETESDKIYKDFQFRLEPSEGKFIDNIFAFYRENKEVLINKITQEEKKRFSKRLLEETVFSKFDIEGTYKSFKISDKTNGSRNITYNSQVPIFRDCIHLIREFDFDINKYRKNIVAFIPYAYGEDYEEIFNLIGELKEKEILFLIRVLNKYPDVCEESVRNLPGIAINQKIVGLVPILKKFVKNDSINIYERIDCLNAIAEVENRSGYFEDIFEKYKVSNDSIRLAESSNEILIRFFNNKNAFKWRINELKERCFKFTRPEGAHMVSNQEDELDSKKFAKVLMELKNKEYEKDFLELLEASFNIYGKGYLYFSYASYIWDIVIAYFNNLKEYGEYTPLKRLERCIEDHASEVGINWFRVRLNQLKKEYILYIGRYSSFSECIKKYNSIKRKQYEDINTAKDVFDKVVKVFNEDIRRWVESEGAYKMLGQQKKGTRIEDLIQKTIKSELFGQLLKNGFRDVDIAREEQLLNDERIDFLIRYGLIGKVLVEIKLTKNEKDIGSENAIKKYKKKLLDKYMKGNGVNHVIFAIFQVNKEKKYSIDKVIKRVKDEFKDERDIVEIIGFNCI